MSTTYIDDQDLTKVTYNGTWAKGGTSHEYGGTVASSTHAGDSFAVSFKGTSITVFGTIDATSEGVVTAYSVDGAPPANVTAPAGSGDTFQQQFWKSPTLSLGQHRLLVTMGKVNIDPDSPEEGTVWFDYFLAFDPSIVSPTSSVASATSSGTSSPSVVNVSNNVAVGAIIGGIIGGLFIMFMIVLVVIFYLRRRDLHHKIQSNEEDVVSTSSIGTRGASIHSPPLQPFTFGPSDTMTTRGRKNRTGAISNTPSSVINPHTSLGPKTHSSSGSNGDSSYEALQFPTAGPSHVGGSPLIGGVRGEANGRPWQSAPSNTMDAPPVDMPPTYTPT
ncbi:hypothetical protein BD779DRAFT_159632 [Infundibulicybe gibba]|nr:hypothetical protein BD779DRAFT_159632 [Infundibulicybe gibba]